MKDQQSTKVLGFILAVIFIIILLIPVVAMNLSGRDVYYHRSQQVEELMVREPAFFEIVFTQIFPQALNCEPFNSLECQAVIQNEFTTMLNSDESQGYESNGELQLNAQLPIYFIQLDGDQIAKLFFSGNAELEPINTRGEQEVEDFLLGKRKSLYGPQMGARFPNAYLEDLYSESEVVVPYWLNNQIVGAVVFLHGD